MSHPNDAIPILMPQLGNTMEEGTIVSWRVKDGDDVKPGDVLFEVETDKATIEVESEGGGKITIVAQPGDTIEIKQPVAYLSGAGSPIAPPKPEIAPSRSHEPVLEAGRQKISPAARKAAEVLGVALAGMEAGSGPGGRILREDVERAALSAPAVRKPAKAEPAVAPAPAIKANPGGSRQPMSKMRKAIAKNLSLSKQTLPHWYTRVTVDAGPMLAYYKREKSLYPCSLNDVILQACARVIMELPMFRSQIDGDDLVQFEHVNIGLAVGQEEGLVVPVVRNVDGRNLKGIAEESRRVVEAARQGKVEGMGEGVFTISNLGMFGVEEFAAIINPPEAAILAVGAVREAVIAKDGAIRAGRVCTMTLSADHRLIDGTMAAKFVGRLKEVLEGLS